MDEIAIYVHYPYCELKCPYCDFNSHVSNNKREDEHLQAFKNEIDFFASQLSMQYKVRSVFFGGGTPSLMQAETVFSLLEYIKSKKEVFFWEDPEITLEANPSSSEYKKFKSFREAGVNRLSIGVQSFNDENLKFLGRKHNASEAKAAILAAKEVFENYSFDLIYCLPGQTLKSFEEELAFAIKNYVKNHISAYMLTIEKGTKFFKMHSDGEFSLPKEDEEFYLLANQILNDFGFFRYEVSNYAKNSAFCFHNLAYWEGIDYIGIGAGAHGRITINNERYRTQNFAKPEKYLELCLTQKNALQVFERLSKDDIIKEALLMNLRSFKGLDLTRFKQKFGFCILKYLNQKHLSKMKEQNLIDLSQTHLILTQKGMSLASSIAQKLSNFDSAH